MSQEYLRSLQSTYSLQPLSQQLIVGINICYCKWILSTSVFNGIQLYTLAEDLVKKKYSPAPLGNLSLNYLCAEITFNITGQVTGFIEVLFRPLFLSTPFSVNLYRNGGPPGRFSVDLPQNTPDIKWSQEPQSTTPPIITVHFVNDFLVYKFLLYPKEDVYLTSTPVRSDQTKLYILKGIGRVSI